jgi:hypothetical protein
MVHEYFGHFQSNRLILQMAKNGRVIDMCLGDKKEDIKLCERVKA